MKKLMHVVLKGCESETSWNIHISKIQRIMPTQMHSLFNLVICIFLGNYKADNNSDLMKTIQSSISQLSIQMSIKVHCFLRHLKRFSETFDTSVRKRENDSSKILEQWKKDTGYIGITTRWWITADCPESAHKQKSWKRCFCEMNDKWMVYQWCLSVFFFTFIWFYYIIFLLH